jgi:hypothetical protein
MITRYRLTATADPEKGVEMTRMTTERGLRRLVIAAVVGLVAVACTSGTRTGQRAAAPGDQQPTVNPADPAAEEVAGNFLQAYGAFEADQAISYLADDADITELITSVGAQGVTGTLKEFRLLIAQLEGTGYKQMLNPCEELGTSASGTTLRCTFDYHLLRSDEIGLGPFSGSSFLLTVRDGEIVGASKTWAIAEFSPQMWEPFASWVSKTHPEDVAVMYEDESQSGVRLSSESSRLWERHTREYVEEVGP